MNFRFKRIKTFAVLICSLLAAVSLSLGISGIYGANAETVTEIPNPGFEELTANMPSGWTTWTALNDKDSSLANVSFSIERGAAAHDGVSMKIVNLSGDSMIRGVVNSPEFEVEGGKTYLLSFWYRSDSEI